MPKKRDMFQKEAIIQREGLGLDGGDRGTFSEISKKSEAIIC